MSKAVFVGRDFKQQVRAVTQFPVVGSFAGAEQVHLRVTKGRATMTTSGIVLARAKVPAIGELPLIGMERRTVEAFASLCSDRAKVVVTTSEKEIVIRSKNREVILPFSEGRPYKVNMPVSGRLLVTKMMAERVKYLSDVAFDDSTKPELNCVMLTAEGEAIACNQKTVAVLRVKGSSENVAVPLPIAKLLGEGCSLFAGTHETVVVNDVATYSISSAVQAQKGFPVKAVRKFREVEMAKLAVCEGERLSVAIQECVSCLGQLARTEIDLDMMFAVDSLQMSAQNGGAQFNTTIPTLEGKEVRVKVPLDGMAQVAPFMGRKVTLQRGSRGEIFMEVSGGWVLFSVWEPEKKSKKK